MTPETQKLKEKLERKEVRVDRAELERICKDRLDFGFDSIYFRYSEAIEELSWFKEREAMKDGRLSFNRKQWCDTRRQHFYCCLEQLLQAHTQEEI